GFDSPEKRTPLHDRHRARGARLVAVDGWMQPARYTTPEAEARAVHEAVGLIDVSSLGKLDVRGREAAAFLDWLHPRRISDLAPGRVRYRILCDDAGIMLDDGIVARLDADRFLVTTTTRGADAMEQWFTRWLAGSRRCVHVVNVTGALGAVSVAGPRA